MRLLSRIATLAYYLVLHAAEGHTPSKYPSPQIYPVDCPDHGKTFLHHSRTACCDSSSWLPTAIYGARQHRRFARQPRAMR